MNARYLPINIDLAGKTIAVIGGGHVALQKLRTLLRFTTDIHVTAIQVCREIKDLPVSWTEKPYDRHDTAGAALVYACSNDEALNKTIRRHAHAGGALVNVADNPKLCDFISPAVCVEDALIISVCSGGRNTRKAIHVRNRIHEQLNSHTRRGKFTADTRRQDAQLHSSVPQASCNEIDVVKSTRPSDEIQS